MSAIAPQTTVGPVHLTVSDLDRSLRYYGDAIGLETLESGPGRASLGSAGRELLVLIEEPGAKPAPSYTGLFHFALLVPERPALARWLAHAARDRVGLTLRFTIPTIVNGRVYVEAKRKVDVYGILTK